MKKLIPVNPNIYNNMTCPSLSFHSKTLWSQALAFIFCLLVLIQPSPMWAAFSPTDLLKDIYTRQNLGNGSYILEIEAISSKDNDKDTARLRVYLDEKDRQLVTFEEPERMKDDCYLVVGYNTWIFQNGMRRPIRISAQQKLFGDAGIAETVGIDYLHDYKVTEASETDETYQLLLLARDKRTAYQGVRLWIRKSDRNIKKVLLLAVNGEPLKELSYGNYQLINGHEVGEVVVKNLLMEKEQQTTLIFFKILEKKIPAEVFQPMMMGKIKHLISNES